MAGKKKTEMKADPFKIFLLLSLCGFITMLLVGYSTLKNDFYVDRDIKLPEFKDMHEDDTMAMKERVTQPIILWWTPFTGDPGSYRTCGDVQCFFTVDRHYWQHNKTKVLLWYGSDFNPKDMPLPRRREHEWGLLHEESPKNNYILTKPEVITLFNHTATFKRESDFPLIFQYVEDLYWLESTRYLLPTKEKNRFKVMEGLASAVYVQSDCNVPSDRDSYVSELMKYMEVDSYGKCVHNKNLPSHLIDPIEGMEHNDFYKMMSKYKFAVSMENAVCDDYVTEKIWRPLMLGVIPVIYGSPKIKDILPDDHSAILVEDFKSPRELADYLNYLDKNDAEYDKYLQWKKTGVTNKFLRNELEQRTWSIKETWKPGRSNFIEEFECFVCERVHENLKLTVHGQRPIEYIADKSHLECPAPKTFFNSRFSSLDWIHTSNEANYDAQALRYFADRNLKITKGDFHAKVSEIRSKDNKWF